jgi:hypothetical protein
MQRLAVFFVVLAACHGVSERSVRTVGRFQANQGAVRVRAAQAPQQAELGAVQVSGYQTVDRLMPEFEQKVAALGGNLGVVDLIETSFEQTTRQQPYTFQCGSPKAPRTCHGMRTKKSENMKVTMVGRAFRE